VVDFPDWNSRAAGGVHLHRDPELVRRDDQNVAREENTTDGYGFADSREELGLDEYAMEGSSRWVFKDMGEGGKLTVMR